MRDTKFVRQETSKYRGIMTPSREKSSISVEYGLSTSEPKGMHKESCQPNPQNEAETCSYLTDVEARNSGVARRVL